MSGPEHSEAVKRGLTPFLAKLKIMIVHVIVVFGYLVNRFWFGGEGTDCFRNLFNSHSATRHPPA